MSRGRLGPSTTRGQTHSTDRLTGVQGHPHSLRATCLLDCLQGALTMSQGRLGPQLGVRLTRQTDSLAIKVIPPQSYLPTRTPRSTINSAVTDSG
jgi:hypothetical protein